MNEEQDPRIEGLARRVRAREEEELAELLRPLDAAERSALADGVFAALDTKQAPEEARPAPVVPIERPKKAGARRRFGFVGALLAAALGALALFVLVRRDEPAPIAAYTLSVEGGNQSERGDEPPKDAVIRLDPASRLSLALRPEAPVSGAIAVRGFLVREGAAKPWEPPMVVGAGGVVRIEGTAAALFGDVPEGAWDVVLLVGRPEALPEESALARAAVSGEKLARWSAHRLRITLSRPRGALGGGGENDGAPRNEISRCAAAPAEVLPDALVQADAARKRGELDRASSLVEGVLARGAPEAKRAAIRQKARIVMATRGRFDEAAALFREALTQDRAAGRLADELDDTFALSYGLLLDKRAFGEARALLDGLGPVLAACPEAEPKAAYYKGLLGIETGDLRAALASFSAAAAGAKRLGLDAYRSAVLEQEAEVLAVLGRHEEAAARLGQARALAGPSADACRRAQLASNAGWIALRASARTGRGLDEAKRVLEEALVITREGCPAGLGNVLVNLALVEHEMGRGKEARARLSEAKRAGGWAELGGWQRMIEARLLLSEGKPKDALAAHEALRAEGERLLLPELAFEGALGRAEALAALGKRGEARAAFGEAEKALTAWGRGVPLGEGRGSFLSARQRGARLWVDFLLREAERGDARAAREAMEAARRSLAGFVQAFHWVNRVGALPAEARGRWDEAVSAYRHERAVLEEKAAARGPGAGGLEAERAALRAALDRALAALGAGEAQEEAPPLLVPAAEEALFVVHPVHEGLAGFVLTDGGRKVEARRLGSPEPSSTPAARAEAWLWPFRAALSNVRRVRLVLPGELLPTDWHALPFDGAPLIERAEVVYSMDLAPRPATPPDGGTAVVIADPTEDLPGARGSAGAVVAALEARGLRVVLLLGQAATHEAVRDALELPSVRILHYAGHATFEGPDGLEASLRLARRGRFSVADVMALARVPEIVVLAGCDTARASEVDAAGGGLGLAQAFLLKGARAAVATPRPMGDALAEQATRLLYVEPIERDPARALRAVTLALRKGSPEGDWAALRLLGE
ncbi:CHAT domain-containing protein [Polyangium sp. y55x31]|uniref:CHAT domain-containing protein n=1 Tax=Polyangium sp. y55x31 TaxID=3042688 RepID=UPI002482B0D7|nr:CHAT domain-containing protein [Polyangium sp. y55x31]MDI1480210.1 CHAT domain-containing protein [Polyangium sp. y55x31]